MKTNSLDFDAQALREKILDLAMRGKLVNQDPNDEPANVLLEKIKAEKVELVKEGKIKKSKDLPEITEDEKPFDIPDSWEWVRLGDVLLNTIGGGTPSKKNQDYWNGKIPWISVKDVHKDELEITETQDTISTMGLKNSSTNLIKANTLIAVMRMAVGRIGVVKMNACINQDLRALITSKNFCDQYLLYIYSHLNFETSGITVKGLKINALLETIIPLPPLSEQSRIAAKIAQLFALLRKVESSTQQYAKLQTLLRSKVLDLAMRGKLVEQDPNDEPASVLLEKEGLKESNEIPHQIPNSWSWIVLGSGVKFINGRAYKKSELLNDSSLTPILRVGNLFTNSSYYYSDLKLDSNKYIDNGDLIYAWSASFGPQIWNGGHVIYHYHIWKVIPKQIIEKQFLYYFLLDKRNVIGETDLHGSTMKHITKTNMEHLSFPLPPLSEQKRIVKKINFLLEIL